MVTEINGPVSIRDTFAQLMRPYVQLVYTSVEHNSMGTSKHEFEYIYITATLNVNYIQPTLLDALQDAIKQMFPKYGVAAVTYSQTLLYEDELCADRPSQLQIKLQRTR